MKFKTIGNTGEFGVERDVTIYSLEQKEEELLREFQEEKERFRENMPERKEQGRNVLVDSVRILKPIIEPFISEMCGGVMLFERYGWTTTFGNGFEVYTESVPLVKSEETSIALTPRFHFRCHPQTHELYCWPTLETETLDKSLLEYQLSARAVYNFLNPEQDGIKKPKISRFGLLSALAPSLSNKLLFN